MFISLDNDRNYLENKYHRTDEEFNAFRRMEYHGYEFDESTGLDEDAIHEGLKKLTEEMQGLPHPAIKAAAASYVMDNTCIDVNEHDFFPGIYSMGRLIDNYTVKPWLEEVNKRGRKICNGSRCCWCTYGRCVSGFRSCVDMAGF